MGIFQGYQNAAPGPGVTVPPPRKGIARYFFLVRNHFGKLVWINFLQIVFSIPLITLPAAVSAANRVLLNLTRQGHSDVWPDFWKEFRCDFCRSLTVGVLLGGLFLLGLWSSSVSAVLFEGWAGTLLGAAEMVMGILCWAAMCYALALKALVELPSLQLIKNGLILMLVAYKQTLCLLVMPGMLLTMQFLFFPASLPLTLIAGVSLAQLGICVIVNEPIDQYVIKPYNSEREKNSQSNVCDLGDQPE